MGTSAVVQKERLLRVLTPLGKDVLLLERLAGGSSVSGLFSYHLDLLADRQMKNDSKVKPLELVGQPFSVVIEIDDQARYLHGIVKEFSRSGRDDRFVHYSAEIVPWTWLLTLQADCRVYQNLTTPEIIQKVLDELKGKYSDIVEYETQLQRTYEKWDCCLQYRETHFNFISRLMEHEGIFYFFKHNKTTGKHTLTLADSITAFRHLEPNKTFLLQAEKGYADREDTVTSIAHHVRLQPGMVTFRDHHFELPRKDLETSKTAAKPIGGNDKLDLYDYPGEYAHYFNKPGERLGNVSKYGDTLSGIRSEEEESTTRIYSGDSDCRAFNAGYRFALNARDSELAQEYVLLSVDETAIQNPSYVSDAAGTGGYHNRFTCIPYGIPYRPRRLTPKPLVSGPQTAIVTVKDGEESWLDKYGRVRVQFHWDREGDKDENSTCWVRVAQPWAGTRWGTHFWPRIGQEVVVEFLEGDPDKPLITGSVYNAANMPPYELPANYTRSGILTRSSKQGGSANFNEIRFEDKKGSEQLFINAEKDKDERVENDSRHYVGNDLHLIVHNEQHELVEADKHGHVKGDQKIAIDGTASSEIKGDAKEKVDGGMSLQVGQSLNEKVGQTWAIESVQTIHIKAGMTLVIEAGTQLSLKGPGGFVDIGPAGVTIQGTMVLINSGGAAASGPGASPQDPDAPKDPDIADDGSKGGKLY